MTFGARFDALVPGTHFIAYDKGDGAPFALYQKPETPTGRDYNGDAVKETQREAVLVVAWDGMRGKRSFIDKAQRLLTGSSWRPITITNEQAAQAVVLVETLGEDTNAWKARWAAWCRKAAGIQKPEEGNEP